MKFILLTSNQIDRNRLEIHINSLLFSQLDEVWKCHTHLIHRSHRLTIHFEIWNVAFLFESVLDELHCDHHERLNNKSNCFLFSSIKREKKGQPVRPRGFGERPLLFFIVLGDVTFSSFVNVEEFGPKRKNRIESNRMTNEEKKRTQMRSNV